jgi:hypothetical protein
MDFGCVIYLFYWDYSLHWSMGYTEICLQEQTPTKFPAGLSFCLINIAISPPFGL